MRIRWREIVDEIAESLLVEFDARGIRPTLRTIFYGLVARGRIPNTRAAYKRLSHVLVKARKGGRFPWDFLVDRTRYSLDYFDDSYPNEGDLAWVEAVCREKLEGISLERVVAAYFGGISVSRHVGRWARQPVVPEIWLEKDALAKTIEAWVADESVTIRVNRGYPSWTFIYDNVCELRRKLYNHERVELLYLGDLDPSGEDIERFLRDALDYFDLKEGINLRRVAVTREQVERYGLPPRPEDAETIRKLERDPRSRDYLCEYVVELDALVVFAPEDFRRLLIEHIEEFFDEDIYEGVKREIDELSEEAWGVVERSRRKAEQKILAKCAS